MGVEELILVANPGSASRKYGLYRDAALLAKLHFEHIDNQVVCHLVTQNKKVDIQCDTDDISQAAGLVQPILDDHGLSTSDHQIDKIGLRIVAPTSYFLEDRLIDEVSRHQLELLRQRAPLHVSATLAELDVLVAAHPGVKIIGISDSKFHASKPDKGWLYGLPLDDADRFEIKRFGYHGISATSIVQQLSQFDISSKKVIICHLGSGASVTAVKNGKSFDTTMGYSPLEGLIMASRSGTIDYMAGATLRNELNMDDQAFIQYLNTQSGLLGLSGISDDIRVLITQANKGVHRARLALDTYIYAIQKAIGQMAGAMNGVDLLVFSGTVGERSPLIRSSIVENLEYLHFQLDPLQNTACKTPDSPMTVSHKSDSNPIVVVSTDESLEMAKTIARSAW